MLSKLADLIEEHKEERDDLDAPLYDGEIENYCRGFFYFMQTQLHRKYDLESSRKRSRMQYQN